MLLRYKNRMECKIRDFVKLIGFLISIVRQPNIRFILKTLKEQNFLLKISNGNYDKIMHVQNSLEKWLFLVDHKPEFIQKKKNSNHSHLYINYCRTWEIHMETYHWTISIKTCSYVFFWKICGNLID